MPKLTSTIEWGESTDGYTSCSGSDDDSDIYEPLLPPTSTATPTKTNCLKASFSKKIIDPLMKMWCGVHAPVPGQKTISYPVRSNDIFSSTPIPKSIQKDFSKNNIKMDKSNCYQKDKVDKPVTKANTNVETFSCYFCPKKVFKSEREVHNHNRSCHSSIISKYSFTRRKCRSCKASFKSNSLSFRGLISHVVEGRCRKSKLLQIQREKKQREEKIKKILEDERKKDRSQEMKKILEEKERQYQAYEESLKKKSLKSQPAKQNVENPPVKKVPETKFQNASAKNTENFSNKAKSILGDKLSNRVLEEKLKKATDEKTKAAYNQILQPRSNGNIKKLEEVSQLKRKVPEEKLKTVRNSSILSKNTSKEKVEKAEGGRMKPTLLATDSRSKTKCDVISAQTFNTIKQNVLKETTKDFSKKKSDRISGEKTSPVLTSKTASPKIPQKSTVIKNKLPVVLVPIITIEEETKECQILPVKNPTTCSKDKVNKISNTKVKPISPKADSKNETEWDVLITKSWSPKKRVSVSDEKTGAGITKDFSKEKIERASDGKTKPVLTTGACNKVPAQPTGIMNESPVVLIPIITIDEETEKCQSFSAEKTKKQKMQHISSDSIGAVIPSKSHAIKKRSNYQFMQKMIELKGAFLRGNTKKIQNTFKEITKPFSKEKAQTSGNDVQSALHSIGKSPLKLNQFMKQDTKNTLQNIKKFQTSGINSKEKMERRSGGKMIPEVLSNSNALNKTPPVDIIMEKASDQSSSIKPLDSKSLEYSRKVNFLAALGLEPKIGSAQKRSPNTEGISLSEKGIRKVQATSRRICKKKVSPPTCCFSFACKNRNGNARSFCKSCFLNGDNSLSALTKPTETESLCLKKPINSISSNSSPVESRKFLLSNVSNTPLSFSPSSRKSDRVKGNTKGIPSSLRSIRRNKNQNFSNEVAIDMILHARRSSAVKANQLNCPRLMKRAKKLANKAQRWKRLNNTPKKSPLKMDSQKPKITITIPKGYWDFIKRQTEYYKTYTD